MPRQAAHRHARHPLARTPGHRHFVQMTSLDNDTLRVGIAQIAPVWLDRDATLTKVISWVEGAANDDCALVAFGEALVPGYPFWIERTDGARFDSPVQKALHAHYVDQAVDIAGGGLHQLQEAAADLGIHVVVGCIERTADRGHSVYCSAVQIGQDGRLATVHRKLMPTYEERLTWAAGDGHGLRTNRVGPFTVGALSCWENWMPLPRAALYAQGLDLHVATWPGNVVNTADITRFVARESRSYVLSASALLRREDIADFVPHADLIRDGGADVLANGGSCDRRPRRPLAGGAGSRRGVPDRGDAAPRTGAPGAAELRSGRPLRPPRRDPPRGGPHSADHPRNHRLMSINRLVAGCLQWRYMWRIRLPVPVEPTRDAAQSSAGEAAVIHQVRWQLLNALSTIRIDGSNGVLPLVQALADAYMAANPGASVTMGEGHRFARSTGLAARRLHGHRDGQPRPGYGGAARRGDDGGRGSPRRRWCWGCTPRRCRHTAITRAQLCDVLAGRVTDWKALGAVVRRHGSDHAQRSPWWCARRPRWTWRCCGSR